MAKITAVCVAFNSNYKLFKVLKYSEYEIWLYCSVFLYFPI